MWQECTPEGFEPGEADQGRVTQGLVEHGGNLNFILVAMGTLSAEE